MAVDLGSTIQELIKAINSGTVDTITIDQVEGLQAELNTLQNGIKTYTYDSDKKILTIS